MQPSSYIEFVRFMRGKNWDKVKIHREFRKRVDKDDYAENEVPQILENLYVLAKGSKYVKELSTSD